MISRSTWGGNASPGVRRRQRGVVMVMVALGAVALIGMAGLALDGGHMYWAKTRLQNALDAAALSAAKTLDVGGDVIAARTAARDTFERNVGNTGYGDLASAIGDAEPTVEFSQTLDPFQPGTTPAQYVRVSLWDVALPSYLIQVLGFPTKPSGGSAVAGPSTSLNEVCNALPVMICGDPDAGAPFFGYELGEDVVLKTAAGGSSEVGPGNFQLIRLDGGQGGSEIRQNMAGTFDKCIDTSEPQQTEPGNTVGPVAQGFNTRFGIYQGGGMNSTDYPPDLVSTHPYSYPEYLDDYATENYTDPEGAEERRVVAVAIGDCTNTTNGAGEVETLGLGCFFATEPVSHKGNEAELRGEFTDGCLAQGSPGPTPGTGPQPHVIQLYKDPDQVDT